MSAFSSGMTNLPSPSRSATTGGTVGLRVRVDEVPSGGRELHRVVAVVAA